MNETNNSPQSPLNDTFIVLKINVGIFLVYTLLSSLIGGIDGVFMSTAIAYCHASLAFLSGIVMLFIKDYRNTGASLILTAFLLAGIGFSFCLGALSAGGF